MCALCCCLSHSCYHYLESDFRHCICSYYNITCLEECECGCRRFLLLSAEKWWKYFLLFFAAWRGKKNKNEEARPNGLTLCTEMKLWILFRYSNISKSTQVSGKQSTNVCKSVRTDIVHKNKNFRSHLLCTNFTFCLSFPANNCSFNLQSTCAEVLRFYFDSPILSWLLIYIPIVFASAGCYRCKFPPVRSLYLSLSLYNGIFFYETPSKTNVYLFRVWSVLNWAASTHNPSVFRHNKTQWHILVFPSKISHFPFTLAALCPSLSLLLKLRSFFDNCSYFIFICMISSSFFFLRQI